VVGGGGGGGDYGTPRPKTMFEGFVPRLTARTMPLRTKGVSDGYGGSRKKKEDKTERSMGGGAPRLPHLEARLDSMGGGGREPVWSAGWGTGGIFLPE